MEPPEKSLEIPKATGRPLGDLTPKTALAERLQQLFPHGTLEENSRACGIKRETWRNYLVGNTAPRMPDVERIIKATGCDGHWLITGEGESFPQREVAKQVARGAVITIPTVGMAAAQQSSSPSIIFDHEGEPLTIPRTAGRVKVMGNSMAPLVRSGQSVVIDTSPQHEPVAGDLVVIELTNGVTLFKRYFPSVSGGALLNSANQVDVEAPIEIAASTIRRMHVVICIYLG